MTLKSAPYYWVVCDKCGKSAQENGEFSAWNDHGMAVDYALDEGYRLGDKGDFCPDCVDRATHCSECDKDATTTEEHEYMCDECWDGGGS